MFTIVHYLLSPPSSSCPLFILNLLYRPIDARYVCIYLFMNFSFPYTLII